MKLFEKSPLKYELTKSLGYLNPKEMLKNSKEVAKNMCKAMETLEASNMISTVCDQKADREFKVLIEEKTVLERCK